MDDQHFDKLADKTLTTLLAKLDEEDGVEAELTLGVMKVGFDAGGPQFVVNSHRAARQIWLAADLHAWHFDPVEEPEGRLRWVSSKEPREELLVVLARNLSNRLSRTVTLLRDLKKRANA